MHQRTVPSKTTSYSLTELLMVIAIIAIVTASSLSIFTKFSHFQNSNVAMRQLQLAIFYARSIAIRYRQNVTICASYNKYSCSDSWQHGILIIATKKSRYFNLRIGANSRLFLQQSGNSNNKINIQPNGLTYTNGHFTYKSLKSSTLPQFNLYFNKALRTYVYENRWDNFN